MKILGVVKEPEKKTKGRWKEVWDCIKNTKEGSWVAVQVDSKEEVGSLRNCALIHRSLKMKVTTTGLTVYILRVKS